MAKAATTTGKSHLKVVKGKKEVVTKPCLTVPIKRRSVKQKSWYDRKIKIWQALLMSAAAVWLFWIFWVVGYVEGHLQR